MLHYPNILAHIGWSADTVARYVSLLRFRAVLWDDSPAKIPPDVAKLLEDTEDGVIVRTFSAGGDDVLVSGDRHLLTLSGFLHVEIPAEFVTRRL